jgi:hypothetical protein
MRWAFPFAACFPMRRSKAASPAQGAGGVGLPEGAEGSDLTERRVRCTNHCSACRGHFHSLEAFDAHRVGDFKSTDPETRRRCAHPLDLRDADGEMRLLAITESGECAMYSEVQHGVTIWSSARHQDAAVSLREGSRSRSEAKDDLTPV